MVKTFDSINSDSLENKFAENLIKINWMSD